MENPTLKLSKLTDAELALCAAQLAAAACAFLPRIEDVNVAVDVSRKLFESQCEWLLAQREKERSYMSAGMDLSR